MLTAPTEIYLTILNPAPGQILERDLLALVDIITPNRNNFV